jgi:hypothetical protein
VYILLTVPSVLFDQSRAAVRRRLSECVVISLRSPPTRLNGKREQRCPLRFHMSSVFENRQARSAHLWRTGQKVQFGAKDQRLLAHKGKHLNPNHPLAGCPVIVNVSSFPRSLDRQSKYG